MHVRLSLVAGYALVRARGDNDAGAGRLTEVQEHAAADGAEHGDHEHGRDAQEPGAVHPVHRDVHRPACEDAGWRRGVENRRTYTIASVKAERMESG